MSVGAEGSTPKSFCSVMDSSLISIDAFCQPTRIAAASWNSLCWFGSLEGFATEVMAACERAVALEPDHGGIRDSRGVARALTEDYPGAINDFQLYLEWGLKNGTSEEQIRQRQDWIRMLQANQNPFNKELLKLLRDE